MPTATAPAARKPFDLASRSVLLTVHAAGAQVYERKAEAGARAAWAGREPVATLVEGGKTIGRRFRGPTWQLAYGSAAVWNAPGLTSADVPKLKLKVVTYAGSGRLEGVSTVYPVDTSGRQLTGSCDAPGALRAVPYTATTCSPGKRVA